MIYFAPICEEVFMVLGWFYSVVEPKKNFGGDIYNFEGGKLNFFPKTRERRCDVTKERKVKNNTCYEVPYDR